VWGGTPPIEVRGGGRVVLGLGELCAGWDTGSLWSLGGRGGAVASGGGGEGGGGSVATPLSGPLAKLCLTKPPHANGNSQSGELQKHQ